MGEILFSYHLSDHSYYKRCCLWWYTHGHKGSMLHLYAHTRRQSGKIHPTSKDIKYLGIFRHIKSDNGGTVTITYGSEVTGVSVDIDDSANGCIVRTITCGIHISSCNGFSLLYSQRSMDVLEWRLGIIKELI